MSRSSLALCVRKMDRAKPRRKPQQMDRSAHPSVCWMPRNLRKSLRHISRQASCRLSYSIPTGSSAHPRRSTPRTAFSPPCLKNGANRPAGSPSASPSLLYCLRGLSRSKTKRTPAARMSLLVEATGVLWRCGALKGTTDETYRWVTACTALCRGPCRMSAFPKRGTLLRSRLRRFHHAVQ